MRPLAILSALALSACAPWPQTVTTATTSSVALRQAGGPALPTPALDAQAAAACGKLGKAAEFAGATPEPDAGMRYLYHCR